MALSIGQGAAAAGVNIQTIRYYACAARQPTDECPILGTLEDDAIETRPGGRDR